MKILHVGNYANVSTNLKRIDINNGNESEIMIPINSSFNFEYDYKILIDKSNIGNIINYFKLGLNYNRIHIHWHKLKGLDLLFFKLVGKEVYIHYHGSDIRNKRMPVLHSLADKFYVSTPDLLEFAPVICTYLPNPIDTSELEYKKYKLHDPIKIIHAPTNREVKGSNRIIQVVQRLKNEGYNIDFKLIENLDHKTAIDKISNCDIVIDQIKIGTYGILAQESMYMGKPVMAYINPKYTINPPIINADENMIYVKLKELLDYPESKLKEIGLAGREYVIEKHVYDEY